MALATRFGRPIGLAVAVLVSGMLGTLAVARAGTAEPDWDAISTEAIQLLREYVRIQTVNPPADTRKSAAFLAEILGREGIQTRWLESAPGKVNLLARLPARGTPAGSRQAGAVMLLHHMDVVPVDASRWPVDPFAGETRDGHLYARGAADMKSLGIIHLMALLTLKRQGIPLDRDLLLLATADEESGGLDGARWMISNHWDEMKPEYVFDEGGFGSRDVLGADGRLVFSVSVAEKKILWAKVIAQGTAGHASQPIKDNANDILVKALAALSSGPADTKPSAVIETMRRRVGTLAVNKFTDAIQRDTMSLTTLRAGVGEPPKVNVIPSAAEATIDCRLMPDTDLDHFRQELLGRLSGLAGVRLETVYRMDDAPVTPWDTPLFAAIERAIRAEHPEAVVTPSIIPYGTDSNAMRVRGAGAYGINPMVVDASIVASMHSDAERVPVAEVVRGVRIFYNMLKDFCGGGAR